MGWHRNFVGESLEEQANTNNEKKVSGDCKNCKALRLQMKRAEKQSNSGIPVSESQRTFQQAEYSLPESGLHQRPPYTTHPTHRID